MRNQRQLYRQGTEEASETVHTRQNLSKRHTKRSTRNPKHREECGEPNNYTSRDHQLKVLLNKLPRKILDAKMHCASCTSKAERRKRSQKRARPHRRERPISRRREECRRRRRITTRSTKPPRRDHLLRLSKKKPSKCTRPSPRNAKATPECRHPS